MIITNIRRYATAHHRARYAFAITDHKSR
jgi:hypothetical protein